MTVAAGSEAPARSLDLLPRSRLAFLDALRGVAALAVVWFHLGWMSPLREPLERVLPWPLMVILRNGHLGVPVFFTLSGFVIARSLSQAQVDWSFFGRFALRRSLRLDPPYWCALLLATGLIFLGRSLPEAPAPPSPGVLLAHAAYLQGILDIRNIASPFWTLPYELQFYLVACGLLGLEQALRRRLPGSRGAGLAAAIAFAPLALGSLAMLASAVPGHGLFLHLWYAFFLGALACRTLEGRARGWWLPSSAAAVVLASAWYDDGVAWGSAATAMLIVMVGRAGGLATWGGHGWLQWLGRISYSLYLTHFVGGAACRLGASRMPNGDVFAILLLLAGTALALIVAWAFHRAIEAPSLALSREERPFRVMRERVRAWRARWIPRPVRET